MSFRTNPDRILENIDRARNRDLENIGLYVDRQAVGRDLETEIPDLDATTTERLKRVFSVLERAYTKAAQRAELGKLASRFQAVGDIHHHHARGDVGVSIQYLDHERYDDVGISQFEITPQHIMDPKAILLCRDGPLPRNIPRHSPHNPCFHARSRNNKIFPKPNLHSCKIT